MTMRIVCACLTLLLVLGMVPSIVSAASVTSYSPGDVNGDGEVNVIDATLVQKYLVKSVSLNARQLKAADVNFDGNITIQDVTIIQKYSVGLIDSFYTYIWTSLYTASKKDIKLNTSAECSVSINYLSGYGWISYKQEGNVLHLATGKNTVRSAREAVVVIKCGNQILSVYIKQLGKNEITSSNTLYFNCYAYALQLSSDPRQPGVSSSNLRLFTPGNLAGISFNPSEYNIINFSLNNCNRTAMFSDVEEYIINRTRADLVTLGWGIKPADSAYATVADGNWLIALVFNPAEAFANGNWKQTATLDGTLPIIQGKVNDYDFHWCRRVGNGVSSYWMEKCGSLEPARMSGLPENIYMQEEEYLEIYGPYADAFISQYDPNIPVNFSYASYCDKVGGEAENEYQEAYQNRNAYVFLGYYEVGPNV